MLTVLVELQWWLLNKVLDQLLCGRQESLSRPSCALEARPLQTGLHQVTFCTTPLFHSEKKQPSALLPWDGNECDKFQHPHFLPFIRSKPSKPINSSPTLSRPHCLRSCRDLSSFTAVGVCTTKPNLSLKFERLLGCFDNICYLISDTKNMYSLFPWYICIRAETKFS